MAFLMCFFVVQNVRVESTEGSIPQREIYDQQGTIRTGVRTCVDMEEQ
jgi:hypothetical protein